jgi:hypothetical protein
VGTQGYPCLTGGARLSDGACACRRLGHDGEPKRWRAARRPKGPTIETEQRRARSGDDSVTCKKIPSTARRSASHSGNAVANATILPLSAKAGHPQMSGKADPHLGGHGPKCRCWWRKVKRVDGVEGADGAADRGSRGGGCVEVLGFTASRNSMGGLRSSRRRSLEQLPLLLPPPPPSSPPACSGVDGG